MDAIKYSKLIDVGHFFGGLSGKSKDDFEDGNAKFITYMNVFSNPSLKINVDDKVRIEEGEKQNVVKYGDVIFTGSSETPDECGMSSVLEEHTDEPLYLNSFCFGYRFNDLQAIVPAFYKHLFRSNSIRAKIAKTANGVTRFNVSKKLFGEIEIPVPSIAVQEKIATQLDAFSSVIVNLETELASRQKQYEHYRNVLLAFDDNSESVEWKSLGEVCIKTSNIKWKLEDESTEYKYIDLSSVTLDTHTIEGASTIDKSNAPSRAQQIVKVNDVLLGTTRPTLKRYCLVPESYDNQICSTGFCVFRPNPKQVSSKWIYYNLAHQRFWDYCEQYQKGASYPSLANSDAFAFEIPFPSLDRQQEIISILDTFELLIANIKQELDARKKQYEYYREKILTFE